MSILIREMFVLLSNNLHDPSKVQPALYTKATSALYSCAICLSHQKSTSIALCI